MIIVKQACYSICCAFRFWDRTSKNMDREGHTWGGIQPQKEDGFTKSTSVHSYGPDVNTTSTIRGLEPYVSR